MQNLIPLLLIGFLVYLIFSRKGGMSGMGCCGGHSAHGDHSSEKENKSDSETVSRMQDDKVIDLQEGRDYVLLPAKDDERRLR